MIRGDRASGYALTGDGKRVLYELRQCVHCQYMWEYVPGSGNTRGICSSCFGLICMRQECADEQRRHLLWAERNGWIMTRMCIPMEEWCQRFHDATRKLERHDRKEGSSFVLSQSGLYVPLGG